MTDDMIPRAEADAPERIYAKYSDAEPYNGKRGLIIDNEPFEGSQEFVRRPRVKPRAESEAPD